MVSVVSLGSGGTLMDMKPGQFGLMKHERFSGPSLILRLDSEQSAALFVRHPETNALGPYAINASANAWGEQEVVLLENVVVHCSHLGIGISESAMGYDDSENRGAIYGFSGKHAFMLYSFNVGQGASIWTFDGERVQDRPKVASRYFHWSLKWCPTPNESHTIFSWPPNKN